MSYRFLQGIDYGPRSGTLGISIHMSEGYDGLPEYLARHPGEDLWEWADRVNGVSCNAAILSTGEIVKMLDDDHASGNLNPDDRAGEYGYYGGSHLRAVLGDGWTNPNEWTLSIELAGFRAKGPTDAQVRSTIKLCNEWKAMFPTIRGATGHHDQSPKPCPGLTPNIRAIFDGIGGHGLWKGTPEVRFATVTTGKLLPVKQGQRWRYLDGSDGGVFGADAVVPVAAKADAHNGQWVVTINTGNPYSDLKPRPTLVLVESAATLVDAPASVDASPFTQADIDREVAAVKAAARVVFE